MRKFIKIILVFLIPIILIGGGIGSLYIIGFLTYAVIEESYTFYYNPIIINEPEKLIISVPGKINIKCNTTTVPYYIKADVYTKAEGIYLRYWDYNYIDTQWYNSSSDSIRLYVYYSLPTLGPGYHPTHTVKYDDAIINITLRTDILYDLQLFGKEVDISGNLSINKLSFEGKLKSKEANISKIEVQEFGAGSLTLELINCNINEHIHIQTTSANINLISNNTLCSKNVEWVLASQDGSIDIKIYQSEDLGANVSGAFSTTFGNINIEYADSLSQVGALFSTTGSGSSFLTTILGGFERIGLNIFHSTDYNTALNIFTFALTTITGILEVEGLSG
ncbi:MAG: hypothetical protein ACFE9Q_13885 [Candidatus Hodarchaeota archaeon]